MKKTICLVTNWYPTKDNPYAGCFFKEQAFAVGDEFDFVIFRYQERIKKNPFKRDVVSICNRENNTIEYTATAYIPMTAYICDEIYSFYINYLSGRKLDGIGRYVSEKRKRLTRRKIRSLFSQVDQSIDVFYGVDGQSDAFYLQCLSELNGKPYTVGEHAPVPWPGTLIKDVNKNAIENANLFLAISNDKIRQMLLQNIKLPKTVYIGNLIDETKLCYEPRDKKHIKTFIIVAAHAFYKNYDMFIQVMERLTKITDEDFRVMIVGYGANKGYSKGVEAFEERIRKSIFAEKAELIPEVPHDKIGEFYNRADAFVMTSIQEGQPVSAMEAACCGLAVFSTRCGGVEDYIEDDTGRIYSVADVEGMANGLKDFLEGTITFDPVVIRRKIVDRFGTKVFVKTFSEAFHGVIDDA